MIEPSIIPWVLLIACLGLFLKCLFQGLRDLILPICFFYFFFAFGPIVSFYMGLPIYFGIPVEYIPEASLIFLTALISMISVSFFKGKQTSGVIKLAAPRFDMVTLKPIFLLSILYAGIVSINLLISPGGTKIDKISTISPALHYPYLMIQIYLMSFFFLIKDSSIKRWYYINAAAYVAYSLVVGERDFIFPLFSIIYHRFVISDGGSKHTLRLFGIMVVLLGVATSLFFIRDASQSSHGLVADLLNQGSLLFVNAFSLKLLHERVDYFLGYTYLNSFFNLLPSWIYKTDFNTLEWFKNSYAAASTSGYGYGLDAEGFINFSYFGVIGTFVLITLLQKKISRHLGDHPFFPYYSVFFCAFTMYSFRNDSLAFMKGNLYGILFFLVVSESSRWLIRRKA